MPKHQRSEGKCFEELMSDMFVRDILKASSADEHKGVAKNISLWVECAEKIVKGKDLTEDEDLKERIVQNMINIEKNKNY